jgi:hypothetical protein
MNLISHARDPIRKFRGIRDDALGCRVACVFNRPAIIDYTIAKLKTQSPAQGYKPTVDVFISQILQSKIDHLIGGSHDLCRIHIATKGIPAIPSQGW